MKVIAVITDYDEVQKILVGCIGEQRAKRVTSPCLKKNKSPPFDEKNPVLKKEIAA